MFKHLLNRNITTKLVRALTAMATIASLEAHALTEADEPNFYGLDFSPTPWNESNHTKDGWDWTLPGWVEPAANGSILANRRIWAAPYGGRYSDEIMLENGVRGNFKRKLSWNWRLLEPTEGNFDFQSLRNEINRVTENGRYKVEFSLYGANVKYQFLADDGVTPVEPSNDYMREVLKIEQSAPRWLVDNVGIPTYLGKKELNHELTIADEYDDRYHQRYLKMVKALGQSGILNNPLISNAYIHFASSTRGEEGVGPDGDGDRREKYEERIRAWVDAYGKDSKKLAITSYKERDLNFAYSLGVGQRNGFVEHYLMHVANPSLATRVNAQGYLEIDESHPLIANSLFSGDENEEYFLTQLMKNRFGDFNSFKHRYRESSLRILQMRRNSIWDERAQGAVDVDMTQFLALSLGQTVATSADAWVYLRQSNLQADNPNTRYAANAVAPAQRNADGSIPAKNFERWLYQRDSNEIKTVATRERGQGGYQLFRDQRTDFDYTARRTDLASGSNRIGFALDDRFMLGGGERIAIKVTYEDNGTNSWNLQYNNGNKQVKRWVSNQNSGKLKTVTWILDDIRFDARGMDNDFYLVTEGGDLTASFVRVIKLGATNGKPPEPPVSNPEELSITSLTAPKALLPGQTFTATIQVESNEAADLHLSLQNTADNWSPIAYNKTALTAGEQSIELSLNVPDSAPLINTAALTAYLTKPNVLWSAGVPSKTQSGIRIQLEEPGLENEIIRVDAPRDMQQGSRVEVTVRYSAQNDATLQMSLQNLSRNWDTIASNAEVISRGEGTQTLALTIPKSAATSDRYALQVYLTPIGDDRWKAKLANLLTEGIKVSSRSAFAGLYRLRDGEFSQGVTVENLNADWTSVVATRFQTNDNEQVWRFEPEGNELYRIRHVASNRLLALCTDDAIDEWERVCVTSKGADTDMTLWRVTQNTEDSVVLRNQWTGHYLQTTALVGDALYARTFDGSDFYDALKFTLVPR